MVKNVCGSEASNASFSPRSATNTTITPGLGTFGFLGVKPGALVIPYGTMSAVEITLTDIMAKVVVDDWGQCRKGMPFGALRRHVDEGRLHEGNLHAELGQIVAGLKPGREGGDETILFWHRGLSTSDIALGCALLDKAKRAGVGQTLRFQ